jgi:hypothetical protein
VTSCVARSGEAGPPLGAPLAREISSVLTIASHLARVDGLRYRQRLRHGPQTRPALGADARPVVANRELTSSTLLGSRDVEQSKVRRGRRSGVIRPGPLLGRGSAGGGNPRVRLLMAAGPAEPGSGLSWSAGGLQGASEFFGVGECVTESLPVGVVQCHAGDLSQERVGAVIVVEGEG